MSDVYGMEQVGVVKHKMLCAACRRWRAARLTSGMERVGVIKHKMLCAACRTWRAAGPMRGVEREKEPNVARTRCVWRAAKAHCICCGACVRARLEAHPRADTHTHTTLAIS